MNKYNSIYTAIVNKDWSFVDNHIDDTSIPLYDSHKTIYQRQYMKSLVDTDLYNRIKNRDIQLRTVIHTRTRQRRIDSKNHL
jgi:hypothetical protein